jgi:phytoene synthase
MLLGQKQPSLSKRLSFWNSVNVQKETKVMANLNFARDIDFQQVLSNPILDIAARFWEDDRYEAFKTSYISMRVMDDLVDERKIKGQNISEAEKNSISFKINAWVLALEEGSPLDSLQQKLLETIHRFHIPLWPWGKLAKSMIYDLYHDGFKDLKTFIQYSEGAAISPGSIFMHLSGAVKENGRYHAPGFDIQSAARPLALFCYLIHIIRDFQIDQNNNLNYLAEDLITKNGLDRQKLREIAAGGEIPIGFRRLIKEYHKAAEHYMNKAREKLDQLALSLKPRYHLSLEIIYSLYNQIFERIDISNGRFTTEELNPSPEDVHARINETIEAFEIIHSDLY